MSTDTEKSNVFLRLDSSTTMVEALRVHSALQYGILETPTEIVEAAVFEMFARQFIVCEATEGTGKGL